MAWLLLRLERGVGMVGVKPTVSGSGEDCVLGDAEDCTVGLIGYYDVAGS